MPSDSTRCPSCGASTPSENLRCIFCGEMIETRSGLLGSLRYGGRFWRWLLAAAALLLVLRLLVGALGR